MLHVIQHLWPRLWPYAARGNPLLARVLQAALVVVLVAVLVYRTFHNGIRRVLANGRLRGRYLDKRRAGTLASTLTSLLRYILSFLVLGTLLAIFGIDLGALAAAAGIGGVAVAFGAQHPIGDVTTGFFLLCEDQLAVGD